MDPVSLLSKAPAYGKPVPACLYLTSIHYSRPKTKNKNSVLSYARNSMMVAGLNINRSFRLTLSIRLLFEKTAANANREKLLSGLPLV